MLEKVGRYRVVRQLGSGGMGEVYLAEDPNLQRQVALKIISSSDAKSKHRFVREAITASRLTHPNVAVVYEAGESDGTAYMAMQHVEGETLRDRLARGAMSVSDIVRVATEVADALDEAHRRGIVHRDIKPGNVMIDSRGHAKVLDFGIAKLLELERLVTPEESTPVADAAGRTASGPSTRDIAAYDLYLKARHDEMFLTRKSFDSAVENYRAAIQRDPSFAEAYGGLAETYSLMDHRPGLTDLPTTETYRLSVEAANKALSLDPDSVEAHTALGHIDMHHGLFSEARAHLDRALQLNPNFANAYLWRAVLLRTIEHYPEARKDAERAEQNDPYSGFLFTFWSSNAWMAGDYASALHAAQRGVEIEPQYGEVYVSLAKTYAVMGKFSEAEEALRRADELKTGAIAEYTRALELALSGRRREAAQLLKGMNNRAQGSSFQGLMRAWAAVGDVDETIRWIDRWVVETPDYFRVGMDLPPHPAFEAVRRDPRYLQARRKLGLPPISDTAGTFPAWH